jgi:hypothetical protein
MYVIEHRTPQDGTVAFWEISASVPRDHDGNPVESGELGRQGPHQREVITQADTLDVLTAYLKRRSDGAVRVTEIERAFEAAQAGAPASQRRVSMRQRSQTGGTVDYGRGRSSTSRSTPSKRLPVVPVLVLVAIVVAVWWFFLR